MSVRFQLGDRVKVTALLERRYGDVDNNAGHIASWHRMPLDEPVEGVVTGYRTAVGGQIESDIEYGEYGHILSQGTVFLVTPGTAQRYWLVVTDLRKNPLKVADDGIFPTDEDSGFDTGSSS